MNIFFPKLRKPMIQWSVRLARTSCFLKSKSPSIISLKGLNKELNILSAQIKICFLLKEIVLTLLKAIIFFLGLCI